MKCAFDMSARMIYETGRTEGIPVQDLLQLRTPLTAYAPDNLGVIPYILDNGAFTVFESAKFAKMARIGFTDKLCMFVIMPDIYGDHEETVARFSYWYRKLDLDEYPHEAHADKLGFVAQDGCTVDSMPESLWDLIGCIFIGGTDSYKESPEVYDLINEAKIRNKWIHVGRVNTPRKIVYFHGLANSFDGSGIARFTKMRQIALKTLKELEGSSQGRIDEYAQK